eukprot:SAG11_NODE_12261_length_712_cov_1.482871_1_plen_135_part_00
MQIVTTLVHPGFAQRNKQRLGHGLHHALADLLRKRAQNPKEAVTPERHSHKLIFTIRTAHLHTLGCELNAEIEFHPLGEALNCALRSLSFLNHEDLSAETLKRNQIGKECNTLSIRDAGTTIAMTRRQTALISD